MGFKFANIILRRDPITKQNKEVTDRIENFKTELLFKKIPGLEENKNKILTQNIINKLAEELSWHFAFILKNLFKRGEVIYRYETNSCWFMDTDEVVYNIATFERLMCNERIKVIDLQTGYEEDPELMDSIIFPTMFDNIGPYLSAMNEYRKEITDVLKYDLGMHTPDTDNTIIILEFKYKDTDNSSLINLAHKGYRQIIEQGYNKVYQLNKKHIHCFGIAFNKKKCEVANTES